MDLTKARAVVFRSPFSTDNYYVVSLRPGDRVYEHQHEDAGDLPIILRALLGAAADWKACTPVEFDEWTEHWMVYVERCYDPPVAIVGADNESEAVDAFVGHLDWAHVDESEADELGDDLGVGPSGELYDPQLVAVRGPLKMHLVIC